MAPMYGDDGMVEDTPENRLQLKLNAQTAQRWSREQISRLNKYRKSRFQRRCWWTLVFWAWLFSIHAAGIGLFTGGFLLSRLILDEHSTCAEPPRIFESDTDYTLRVGDQSLPQWTGLGTVDGGCWYPKTFDRAVVVLIDALRYDFTVPVGEEGRNGNGDGAQIFHNAFPIMHDTAVSHPEQAFLRPFIADPPTTTLQRLKGLTTGTLPTFMDIGSNFAGTAIEEDNLLMQFRNEGKRIVHLGDDTWEALFPGYFEPNISHAYDSFNVWDLHTVDNGVLDHIFPLMQPDRKKEWDLLIGHFLGVDHAGHRYGPDHSAMKSKLQQMDQFIRDLMPLLDDDTLLIVMGDHGMDDKGDHGGESDDEVEAALWMYSSRPAFGRTSPDFVTPPATAKVRPVNQIDLVPTLALLLGIPIPYNNLGRPIDEAFVGTNGDTRERLAAASQIAAANTNRYMGSYFSARGLEDNAAHGSPLGSWKQTESAVGQAGTEWTDAYIEFNQYQEGALGVCKELWARFDIRMMVLGILIMFLGVVVLLLYVSRFMVITPDYGTILEQDELAKAGEIDIGDDGEGLGRDPFYMVATQQCAKAALLGTFLPLVVCLAVYAFTDMMTIREVVSTTSLLSIFVVLWNIFQNGSEWTNALPSSLWGWMAVVFTVSQSIGFAANSYTVWEDSITLFFLSTFGLASFLAAFRIQLAEKRSKAVSYSILFMVLTRLADFSKLCREEQMPYCTSTYYASSTSSTSSIWQLFIPFTVAIVLPMILQYSLERTSSYEGLAPNWIGYVFRVGLFMISLYWTVDAADNGNWFPSLPPQALKTLSVYIARVIIALTVVFGTTAFVWSPPCVSIVHYTNPGTGKSEPTVHGYNNVNGARYLLLVINMVGLCLLLTKPMGAGALAIMLWQVLLLVELCVLHDISEEPIGPIVLALMGNFYYFKTGHQAVLSSIQWDSAFVPFFGVVYPWSPVMVVFNHFAGQVIAVAAVPLVVMWRTGPGRMGLLESVGRALGMATAFYAVEALATMAWAGYLRRHLMLYRVFSPRYMMASAVLLLVDVVGMVVAIGGTRVNTLSSGEFFGFAD